MTTNNNRTTIDKACEENVIATNLSLSTETRERLNQLAVTWDLSLSAALRRSIDSAYDVAMQSDSISLQQTARQNKIDMLVTLLAIHTEIMAISNNTTNILTTMPLGNEMLQRLEKLSDTVTDLLQVVPFIKE
jgi:hypothetical protein